MNRRQFAIAAAAALLGSTPLAAEPAPAAKPAPAKPAAGQPAAPTLLASADVGLSETKADTAAPKPHRNARVTTCRCADVAPPQN